MGLLRTQGRGKEKTSVPSPVKKEASQGLQSLLRKKSRKSRVFQDRYAEASQSAGKKWRGERVVHNPLLCKGEGRRATRSS